MDDNASGQSRAAEGPPSGLAARTDPSPAVASQDVRTTPPEPVNQGVPSTHVASQTRPHPKVEGSHANPDRLGWIPGVAGNSSWQVVGGIVLVAVVVAGVAAVLKAQAKEIVSVATAIAGLSTIAVGLALSKDAFKLLYDKEAHQNSADGKPEKPTALQNVAAGLTGLGGVEINLNDLLPKLITRAAGLAIAVLLFGVLLLTGASFSTPATSTTSTTTSSTSTTGSSTTTATETTQVTTTTR